MKSKKLFPVLLILLPLLAAVLNALPNAVRLNWMDGYTTYCSGYSLLPVGYAVWGPMGAGIGAIVLTVLGVVSALKKDEKLMNAMFTIAVIAALLALSAALFRNMTLTGGIITALLTADAVLLYFAKNRA